MNTDTVTTWFISSLIWWATAPPDYKKHIFRYWINILGSVRKGVKMKQMIISTCRVVLLTDHSWFSSPSFPFKMDAFEELLKKMNQRGIKDIYLFIIAIVPNCRLVSCHSCAVQWISLPFSHIFVLKEDALAFFLCLPFSLQVTNIWSSCSSTFVSQLTKQARVFAIFLCKTNYIILMPVRRAIKRPMAIR